MKKVGSLNKQNKKSKSIGAFLFHYNIPLLELDKVEERIRERNSRALKVVSSICALLFSGLLAMSFFIGDLRDNMPEYLFAAAGMLIVAFYEWFFIRIFPKLQTGMLYVFLAILNIFAILLGTFASPDELAVIYIVLLLTQSAMAIDRPVRLLVFQLCSMMLFTVAAVCFKKDSVLVTDIVNVWTIGALSLGIGSYTISSGSTSILTSCQLENLGVIDQLTGLQNRNCYERNLKRYPYKAKMSLACVFMDVNGLHAMNDKEGHENGDRMLQYMALGFRKAFGEKDTYRIGGDEFVAIPVDMGIDEIREKIRILNRTFAKRDYHAAIGCAFAGVSRNKDTVMNMMPLIKSAEEDMYREKEEYYRTAGLDERSQRDAALALKEQSKTLAFIELDDLTGLYTKQAFYHHAQMLLRRNPDTSYHVIMIDIDNFKYFNERYGEEAGDRILRKMGNHISTNSKCCVLAGHFNGDVFVLLAEQREQTTEELIADCSKSLMKDPDIQKVSLKFGVYENVEHALPVSVLCDRAIIALRSIKRHYGIAIGKYNEELRKKNDWENKLENDMNRALKQRQFQVYYQPKHDTKTGALIGAEALIRWIHPEYGFISPGDFIPLFERNGFVAEADFYVWESVCSDLRSWMDNGIPTVPVSVNSSKVDFADEHYWERIHNPVERYRVQKDKLHIEVTETLISENMNELVELLRKLQEEGFKIEMDDFGKGYSCLNTLGTLPLDIVKLDMSFISQIRNDRQLSVLSSVIGLSRSLNLITVAEGVETREQAEVLQKLGCDGIQGYFFSKPLPKIAFTEYLKKYS